MLLLPSLSLSGFWPSHSLAVANTFHPTHRPLLLEATRARAEICRPDPLLGDESEPPIPASPPPRKDRDEVAEKHEREQARIAKMEKKRRAAAKRVERARKRGLLKDPDGIKSILQEARDPALRAIMEGLIQVELEKSRGKSAKGANQGRSETMENGHASKIGIGGNQTTRGREDERSNSRAGRRRLLGDITAPEYTRSVDHAKEIKPNKGVVEAVGGADANGEDTTRMNSIRCAQLQVRTCSLWESPSRCLESGDDVIVDIHCSGIHGLNFLGCGVDRGNIRTIRV